MTTSETARNRPVLEEFQGVALGDRRLDVRAQNVAAMLAAKPEASFPKAIEDPSEQEALYRFLRNRRTSYEALIAPHHRATSERVRAYGRTVVVAHDTTDFTFPGEERREGLGYINTGTQGFLGHFAMAVTADEDREPLGIVDQELWTRTKQTPTHRRKRGELTYSETLGMEKESARWGRLVDEVTNRIGNNAVHVMDSEADDYALFCKLVSDGRRFVIRLCNDRRIVEQSEHKLFNFLAKQEVVGQRTARLGSKGPRRIKTIRDHARKARTATLDFSSARVILRRPQTAPKDLSRELAVNVVRVQEREPPPGCVPVSWVLVTTEQVSDAQQIERVIDYYRARWVIEEFFKALKTGCSYEKRQLESYKTLRVALGFFVPIAWWMLRLRTLAHRGQSLQVPNLITPIETVILRAKSPRGLPDEATPAQICDSIAGLGGHMRRNGDPGWQVLIRGYMALCNMAVGYQIALDTLKTSRRVSERYDQ